MGSGKDTSFKIFEGECGRCKKGVKLGDGVRLKGGGRNKLPPAFDQGQLYAMYEAFENGRIQSAKALVGDRAMQGDSFCKFLALRTDLCPHSLITPESSYWLETVSILDGEMGLTLPDKAQDVPNIFYEALAIVRGERARVNREDNK